MSTLLVGEQWPDRRDPGQTARTCGHAAPVFTGTVLSTSDCAPRATGRLGSQFLLRRSDAVEAYNAPVQSNLLNGNRICANRPELHTEKQALLHVAQHEEQCNSKDHHIQSSCHSKDHRHHRNILARSSYTQSRCDMGCSHNHRDTLPGSYLHIGNHRYIRGQHSPILGCRQNYVRRFRLWNIRPEIVRCVEHWM